MVHGTLFFQVYINAKSIIYTRSINGTKSMFSQMDKCQIGKYNLIDEFQKTNVCLMFEAYKKDRLLLDIIPLEVLKETSELMSMSELIDKGNGRN